MSFDKVGKLTERELVQSAARGQVDSLAKPERYGNGDIQTRANGSRPECSKLISQLYQTEGYLTLCTDELNGKQGKNKEKKSRTDVNLGSEQREVPGLNLQRQGVMILTPQKPL